QKVREDRDKVTAAGFWIYNDLDTGFRTARQTGKPLLVVLRCIPCEECVKLDDELVDQDPVLRPLLEQFVCVRVVSTNGLDLSLFQFDTDSGPLPELPARQLGTRREQHHRSGDSECSF
ncbi:MAG: thioredoxin family protein, partial [Planctomycetaceae bacterium]